ncbi:unnamed protein product [Closterium sp. NIES-64]|nr:unnamed protein product [Closterium sp. NIES-64]
MASAGISSMGNGKAVRALLAIVAVIAACLPQPSQAAAAASVSVPVLIGTPMTINGRTFKFSPRRCVNLPAMSPSQKARVVVPWQQASMSGKAMLPRDLVLPGSRVQRTDVGLFREWPTEVRLPFLLALLPCSYALDAARLLPHLINDRCTRGALPSPVCSEKRISGAARSALCLVDNMCRYARCPAGSDTCTPPTDDRTAVTLPCQLRVCQTHQWHWNGVQV